MISHAGAIGRIASFSLFYFRNKNRIILNGARKITFPENVHTPKALVHKALSVFFAKNVCKDVIRGNRCAPRLSAFFWSICVTLHKNHGATCAYRLSPIIRPPTNSIHSAFDFALLWFLFLLLTFAIASSSHTHQNHNCLFSVFVLASDSFRCS